MQHPNARGLAIEENLLFVAYDSGGIRVIDVADKAKPREIARYINAAVGNKQQAYNNIVIRGRLAYAGFDVYDREPLPLGHPLRSAPNVILTPHIGYVTDENYRSSYPQIVGNVIAFLDGKPVRVI